MPGHEYNIVHNRVALRKESVDRNSIASASFRAYTVALRKESVDRNLLFRLVAGSLITSLSARRAWIEIIDYVIDYVNDAVALRKESVDRNSAHARTAFCAQVALRKESVDRNYTTLTVILC